MNLVLGVHRPTWLEFADVPLMVSLSVLPARPRWRPRSSWMLDSGGFTELQNHGRWRTSVAQHVDRVSEAAELGQMTYASPQDWMCEPVVISGGAFKFGAFVGTGLSVREHQERTVENLVELRRQAPGIPWLPVLQGWAIEDYHAHLDGYAAAGVDLRAEPLVGVGSICRRESMPVAAQIIRSLHERGLRLHGFGFKRDGIGACWPWLESADSMAWSFNARYEGSKYGRTCGRVGRNGHPVKSCANCWHYAAAWRERTLAAMRPQQCSMPWVATAYQPVEVAS